MPRFSLRLVWETIRNKFPEVQWHKLIWDGWQLPSSRILCWLVLNGRLAVKEAIANWGLAIDIGCVLCDRGVDSRSHLFFSCPFSQQVLLELLPEIAGFSLWEAHVQEACRCWSGNSLMMKAKRMIWCLIVSDIWKERCRRVFEGEHCTTVELVRDIRFKIGTRLSGKLGEEQLLTCLGV
ncbi:hypothetical protein LINGRAPRIM_LOCUS993 [Linum grandiflorum]